MANIREEFGEKIREVLERHGSLGIPMSPRAASRRTRQESPNGEATQISHQTIRNWMEGQVPSKDLLIQFADGLKEPLTPLWTAAGWILEPEIIERDRNRYPDYRPAPPSDDKEVVPLEELRDQLSEAVYNELKAKGITFLARRKVAP